MECMWLSATCVKDMGLTVKSPTYFFWCRHSAEYFEGLTKCHNLYESLFQELHHIVKLQCFEVLTGLNNNKKAYHESGYRSSMF